MRKSVKGAALALTSAAALAGSMAVSSPAMAASTPIGACGGGSYHVIDQHKTGSSTIYLLYNGSTNCVVNWLDSPGPQWVEVSLKRQSDNKEVRDSGSFTTYAGPVKLSAAGTCIKWGGVVGYGYPGWTSPWSHCG